MNITNHQLITFFNVATSYLQLNRIPTKLTYALAKMQKRAQKVIEVFNNELEDFRLDLALEDEKTKEVLREVNGDYKFTKENTKKVIEKRRELLTKEISIEPYIATTVPADLTDDFRVEFEGFVLESVND